jgi:hypothetical protein
MWVLMQNLMPNNPSVRKIPNVLQGFARRESAFRAAKAPVQASRIKLNAKRLKILWRMSVYNV